VPVAVLLALPFVLLAVINRLTTQIDWQQHSYDILGQAAAADNRATGLALEVAQYRTTHSRDAIDRFRVDAIGLETQLNRLATAVADNPAQTARARQLLMAYREWRTWAEAQLQQRSIQDADMAAGRALRQTFQERSDQLTAAEQQLLAERTAAANAARHRVLSERLALIAIVVIVIGWWVWRQMRALDESHGTLVRELVARNQALRTSEDMFRSTFENAAVGVAHASIDNRFLRANEALSRITGYPHDELLAKTFVDITHPDDVAKDLAQARQLARGEISSYSTEKRSVRKDGTQIWINLTASAVRSEDGTVQFFIAIIEEITARRLAEVELATARQTLAQHAAKLEQTVSERTAQLQETVQELSAFSYSVSHDLRAPLRAIQGFSDLLIEAHGTELPEESRDHLRRIVRAGQKMDRLITDVLAYSRAGRGELVLENIDIAECIHSLVQSQYADRADAILVDANLPAVRANRIAVEQCLANLIGNALKFARSGVPSRVTISATPRGEMVRVAVADNGIGIAPEHRTKVWDAFERLRHDIEGTGIGLAIVRRVVQRMGGSVGIDSEVGVGSTFWFELPKAV